MLLARQPTARCSSLLMPGRDGPPGQPGVHRRLIERPAPPVQGHSIRYGGASTPTAALRQRLAATESFNARWVESETPVSLNRPWYLGTGRDRAARSRFWCFQLTGFVSIPDLGLFSR
jgi:hypothetical protein